TQTGGRAGTAVTPGLLPGDTPGKDSGMAEYEIPEDLSRTGKRDIPAKVWLPDAVSRKPNSKQPFIEAAMKTWNQIRF
ncbi:Hypothetical predicted protein, partial [Pelobates cultripes]